MQNKSVSLWWYLPFPLAFLAMMLPNFFTTEGANSDKEIHDLISQIGINGTFVAMVIPLSIGCFALWAWVKWVHHQSITSLTTARKKIDWNRIIFSFVLWGSLTALLTLIDFYFNNHDYVINFHLKKFLIFLLLALLLIPFQTSFEEYLFRGYLMQGIGFATKNRLIPLLVTSILFGVLHGANPEVEKLGYIILIYYIGTGFFLGIIALMDDGIELGLGFHAANNLIGALLVTSDWTVFQTHSILKDVSEPTVGFDVLLPVFIIYPVLLLIFSQKYNWTNWREKLTGKLNLNEIENE